jgi:hypothetical protein
MISRNEKVPVDADVTRYCILNVLLPAVRVVWSTSMFARTASLADPDTRTESASAGAIVDAPEMSHDAMAATPAVLLLNKHPMEYSVLVPVVSVLDGPVVVRSVKVVEVVVSDAETLNEVISRSTMVFAALVTSHRPDAVAFAGAVSFRLSLTCVFH